MMKNGKEISYINKIKKGNIMKVYWKLITFHGGSWFMSLVAWGVTAGVVAAITNVLGWW